MKSISIGFSKSSSFIPIFSWLIMLTERTPYSHVYLKYLDEELNREVYYQASHTLVNYMGSEVFSSEEIVIQEFNFQISDASFLRTKQFAIDNAGKPYGVMSIVGLGLVQLASFLGIRIHNPFKDAGKTYICDQLVAALLENCENITLPMDINDITPADLYNIVKGLPSNLS